MKALKKVQDMKAVKRVQKFRLSDLKNASVSFWVFVILLLLTALIIVFDLQTYIKSAVITHGILAIFLISFIADLSIQPIGPDVPLVFAVLFTDINPVLILLSVLFAAGLAILLAYYIGKRIGATGIEKIVGKKRFNKIQSSKNYGKIYLLVSAISPIPYIPYLAGLFNLSLIETIKYLVIPRFVRFTIVFMVALQVGPVILNWITL